MLCRCQPFLSIRNNEAVGFVFYPQATGYDDDWHEVPVSETQPSQDIVCLGQILTAKSVIELHLGS